MIRGLSRRLVLGVVLGVLVFAGFSLYADVGELQKNLAAFEWTYLPAILALVMVNYALRFCRWQYYLGVTEVHVPLRSSASIFLAGFVMSVTPGKFGELLKAYLLKEAHGAPMARTAPVVVAERLTDFISLVLLCGVGIVAFDYGAVVVAVCGALSVAVVVLISSRALAHSFIELTRKVPGLRRFSDKLHEMYESMADLVRPGPLLWATTIGLFAWLAECIAVYLVCLGLGAEASHVSFALAAFIHAFATIFGAITLLPGGLGVTEGSMSGLFVLLGKMTKAPAVTATLLVRLCTLWFGVALGALAMAWRRGRFTSTPAAVADSPQAGD
jgi:uncharacterized protein (TIRG00374 family)